MVRTSVEAQSRRGDWGVRGPGMKVRPELEKVPRPTRAHMWTVSATSQPSQSAAKHMCEACANG